MPASRCPRARALVPLVAALLLALVAGCTPTPAAAPAQPAAMAPAALATPAPAAPNTTASQGVAASQGAAATPALVDEATAKAGIQKTLDARAKAIQAKDAPAYMATVDQENLTWKRVQSEQFRQYVEGAGGIAQTAKVLAVRHHRGEYYKATIDVGAGAKSAQTWIFRPVDGKWLFSEPIERELGERKTKETAHFKLNYYDWDSDVVDRMAALAEQAYGKVTKALNKEPGFRTTVYIRPTFQTFPGRGGHSLAAFFNPDVPDTIYVRSLESYGTRPAPGLSQEDELLWSLAHEFTHLVNNQIVRVVKMPEWMTEGLAEYVASPIKAELIRDAVASGKLNSLDELDRMISGKGDFGFTPIQVRRAYDESISVVEYLITKYGIEKFWAYAADYATSRSLPESTQKVLGVSYQQLGRDWQQWVKQKYG